MGFRYGMRRLCVESGLAIQSFPDPLTLMLGFQIEVLLQLYIQLAVDGADVKGRRLVTSANCLIRNWGGILGSWQGLETTKRREEMIDDKNTRISSHSNQSIPNSALYEWRRHSSFFLEIKV